LEEIIIAKRKEPSLIWCEDNLIKILPVNCETVYFTDFTNEMYQLVNDIRWAVYGGYLRGYINGKSIALHHLVLPKEEGMHSDHVNRKKNDNRRCNLRNITPTENYINRGLTVRNTSGYLGVSWNIKNEKWMASIRVNKKSKNLGYYDNPQEAHEIFKLAAEEYYPGILYPEQIQVS